MCRQWQLSGLPCGHVCAVCRVENLTNCNTWTKTWFMKTTLKATYREMVFPLDEEANWHKPGDLQTVKPPLFPKNQSGRPKEPKRFLSKNEDPKSKNCGRCGATGHNRDYCMAPLPSTQEKSKSKNSGTDKGKGVMQQTTTEHDNRKRKSSTEQQTHVEHNTDVDDEYIQNGRIYQDWDEVCWIGEQSNMISDGDVVWGGNQVWGSDNHQSNQLSSTHYHTGLMGEPSNRFGEASVLWDGQAATSSVYIQSQHESSNHYQSTWTGEQSNRLWDGGMLWGGEASNSTINPISTNAYHLDDF
ncbi:hypothetical protein CTI12_AA368790 [Artemisia annua]|uniref:Zinc finger PMZ-type domain-containing protein n=1 Tax=Artemisia annua TaxID=35608 RepID=A0A2U1MKR0_ARTAN|nr:hypothetical protein CTI12_AA368790 [Artemisia annua]